jgi:hypothetical protein
MRFVNKAVIAAGLGFTASAVVGCGSSGDLLSSAQATALRAQLSRASAALSAGECDTAAGFISNFQTRVDDLGSVNRTLVNNLQAGATKIEKLAAQDCPTDTTPTPTPVHTTPPKRHTTPPKTTPTSTTSTDTVPTTTTSTTTSTPTQTGTTTTTTTTTTGTTDTGTTETGTSSTETSTSPVGGLTGPSTTSSTSSTTTAPPASGGGGLNPNVRRYTLNSSLPPGWQHHQGEPGAGGWHGNGHGYGQYNGDQGDGYGDGQGQDGGS